MSVSASSSAAKTRRSVLDYFFMVPFLGNGEGTIQQKRDVLQSRSVIDLKNDYLLVHPDSSPAQQVTVFRARQHRDVVAVSLPDWHSDYNHFVLYELRNGHLADVTTSLLPMPARTSKYLYELPRFGTTIRVHRFDLHRQKRWHAFNLQWSGGRFRRVS